MACFRLLHDDDDDVTYLMPSVDCLRFCEIGCGDVCELKLNYIKS